MIKVALAGLLGRKLRTALTAVAIVLGVAMVSGTFVLTDSIDKAFNSIFTSVRKGSDVVITGNAATSTNSGSFAPTLPASLLTKVQQLPDVALAEGSVNGEAQLIDSKGKAIVFGGSPNLGFSISRGDSPFNPLSLVSGNWPHGDQVVIDRETAKKKHFAVGQKIGVQAEGPVTQLTISGIVKFGSVGTIGGATLAGFDTATAQRLFDKPNQFDEIAISASPKVSEQQVLREVRSVIPSNAKALSGTQQAAKDAKDTNSFVSFLRGFLLAFGGIALFVGSFVIANSLSITIAQRTREFATLRTIGASRRQVLQAIIVESLVVGTLASVVGLFLGLGIAKGLFKLFNVVGFTLPNSGLIFATRTIVVSLLVGIVVSLVASLRPAIRATRVPPIAAVREGAILPPSRFAKLRTVGSGVVTVGGFAAMIYGLFGKGLGTTGVLVWMGLGALLIFVGVSLLAVRIVRPLAGLLGEPARRLGGSAGALAVDNAQRNPQRTASTAAALMIGLALVTFVAVLAAGITSSFRGAVDKIWHNAEYAITAQNNFSPIPIAGANAVATAPGVEAVGNVRTGDAKAFGHSFFATAVNPPGATHVRARLEDRLDQRLPDARRRRRLHRHRLRQEAQAPRWVDVQADVRDGCVEDVPRDRHLQAAARRVAVRDGHDLADDLGQVQPEPAEHLLVRAHEGRADRRQPCGSEREAEGVPECQGPDAAAVHRQPDQRSQLGPQHPVCAARALGDREPVRDREHARPDGLRAHP